MTTGIALAATLAYLAVATMVIRWRYTATRPFTEPLTCRDWLSCRAGKHDSMCYRRTKDTLIGSATEALLYATGLGLIWPLALLAIAGLRVARLLVRGTPELPGERAAKIARLERENGIRP